LFDLPTGGDAMRLERNSSMMLLLTSIAVFTYPLLVSG
jgi:hypothetical protein